MRSAAATPGPASPSKQLVAEQRELGTTRPVGYCRSGRLPEGQGALERGGPVWQIFLKTIFMARGVPANPSRSPADLQSPARLLLSRVLRATRSFNFFNQIIRIDKDTHLLQQILQPADRISMMNGVEMFTRSVTAPSSPPAVRRPSGPPDRCA